MVTIVGTITTVMGTIVGAYVGSRIGASGAAQTATAAAKDRDAESVRLQEALGALDEGNAAEAMRRADKRLGNR